MLPDRLTIRLSPELAAKLAARGGPHGNLAAIVRQAIEAYLAADSPPRQPRQPPRADMTATAATVADMSTRLATLELRIAALEATTASGSQRQPPRQPAPQPRQPGAPTPRPPGTPYADVRGTMRRQILALLQDHPEGLTPAEMRTRLGATKRLAQTCIGMRRDGLIRRVERGRYVAAELSRTDQT